MQKGEGGRGKLQRVHPRQKSSMLVGIQRGSWPGSGVFGAPSNQGTLAESVGQCGGGEDSWQPAGEIQGSVGMLRHNL